MAQKGIGLGFVGIGFDDRSSFHWFKAANVLERSYRALLREAQAGQKRWRDLAPAPEGGTGEIPRRANRSYWSAMERLEMIRPAAMLAGMSIECTLKGIIAIHQSPPKRGHPLLKLAADAKVSLAPEHAATLTELESMIQLGRYYMKTDGTARFDLSSSRIDALLRAVSDHANSLVP
ncbi:MAG: hypothetical protein JNM34_09215 [Chthonomonadaceae bacterium]|nr:hypothetical protein [Chthonomonadaceae bacterium]